MAHKAGRVRVVLRKGHRAGEIAAHALDAAGRPSRDPRKVAIFDADNVEHREQLSISGMRAVVLMAGGGDNWATSVSRHAYEEGRRRRRER